MRILAKARGFVCQRHDIWNITNIVVIHSLLNKTQVPIAAPQYLQAQKVYHKHSTKILRSVSSMLPNEKMQHQKTNPSLLL